MALSDTTVRYRGNSAILSSPAVDAFVRVGFRNAVLSVAGRTAPPRAAVRVPTRSISEPPRRPELPSGVRDGDVFEDGTVRMPCHQPFSVGPGRRPLDDLT